MLAESLTQNTLKTVERRGVPPFRAMTWLGKATKAQTILEVCFGSALYMLQGAAWEVYAIEIRRRGKSALALLMATELDTIRTVA